MSLIIINLIHKLFLINWRDSWVPLFLQYDALTHGSLVFKHVEYHISFCAFFCCHSRLIFITRVQNYKTILNPPNKTGWIANPPVRESTQTETTWQFWQYVGTPSEFLFPLWGNCIAALHWNGGHYLRWKLRLRQWRNPRTCCHLGLMWWG